VEDWRGFTDPGTSDKIKFLKFEVPCMPKVEVLQCTLFSGILSPWVLTLAFAFIFAKTG
jgi:hypothetical protein